MARFEGRQSAVVDKNTAATHEIVAAPGAGKKIRIHSYVLTVAAAVSVTWKSGTTAKTGAMPLSAGIVAPTGDPEDFYFECAANEALNMTLSGAVQTSGHVGYSVVSA